MSDFSSFEDLDKDSSILLNALNKQEDLPLVLMSVEYISVMLKTMLKNYLLTGNTTNSLLEHGKGILGDYSQRVKLCYSLGMIPKGIKFNLDIIAKIRNKMAHSYLETNFNDTNISQLCYSLKSPIMKGKRVNVEANESSEVNQDNFFDNFDSARNRFTTIILLMVIDLKKRTFKATNEIENKWL